MSEMKIGMWAARSYFEALDKVRAMRPGDKLVIENL